MHTCRTMWAQLLRVNHTMKQLQTMITTANIIIQTVYLSDGLLVWFFAIYTGYWWPSLFDNDIVKNATKVVRKWDIPFNVWGAVLSRPGPAVLLTPLWKPPKNFFAYAPDHWPLQECKCGGCVFQMVKAHVFKSQGLFSTQWVHTHTWPPSSQSIYTIIIVTKTIILSLTCAHAWWLCIFTWACCYLICMNCLAEIYQ